MDNGELGVAAGDRAGQHGAVGRDRVDVVGGVEGVGAVEAAALVLLRGLGTTKAKWLTGSDWEDRSEASATNS